MIRAALAASFLLAFASAVATAADPPAAKAAAPTIALSIATADGPRRFHVEIASTPAEQERGLMFRRSMKADHGMIFPMSPPRPVSFWMKNTLIPLDIIFIGPDHMISSIAARATPMSLATIDSFSPVSAVLELNGGTCERLGIQPGDRVAW